MGLGKEVLFTNWCERPSDPTLMDPYTETGVTTGLVDGKYLVRTEGGELHRIERAVLRKDNPDASL